MLVVHSYHKTQKGHVVEMTRGIEQAFSGAKANLHYFFMDTKRNTDPVWKKKAGILAAREMIRLKPRVVIAMDDNAQKYFVVNQMNRENSPDFVFGGVNAQISAYGYPRPNVTGVIERPNIQESLELLLKIRPDVKKVLMISDKSRTMDLFVEYCKTLDLPVKVAGYVQPRTLGEWKQAVDEYKDKVDAFGIYVLRTIKEKKGSDRHVLETRLMDLLHERSGLSSVGFFDTLAASGVLCGISVSMEEQGYAAGAMARSILEGESPDSFSIEPTRRGRIQLNLKTAERLGLPLAWKIISKADVVIK
ncbi:MAG: hypothetical protein HUK40_02985 [Desulfobacter sp.]|nr:hypothetical protein [Desulfobacter sp.]